MRLRDVKWENGRNAEEVVMHGIDEITDLLDLLDELHIQKVEEDEKQDSRWPVFLYYEIKDRLKDLEEYIFQIADETEAMEKEIIERCLHGNHTKTE